jgi:hypothetical protein
VAVHPAARRRPKPRSGLRRHDGCGYFIASVTHRRTLPVPQPHCAMASERWCYAARPAELTSSKTEPATLRRLQSSIHHLLSRAPHHSPAPPRRQIAIDGHRPCRPPRVPSLEAFGRRPSARVDRSRRGRHPKPFTNWDPPYRSASVSIRVHSGRLGVSSLGLCLCHRQYEPQCSAEQFHARTAPDNATRLSGMEWLCSAKRA